MSLNRLVKSRASMVQGACPALYSDDDPAKMIAQGKKLTAAQTAELRDVADDETAVELPTETVFRGVAKYATEHGDDELPGKIEAFLNAKGLSCLAGSSRE